MTSYNSVFGNSLQPSVYNSFTSIGTFTAPFTTNIQLAWSTQFQNGLNVVSTIMNFYPFANGLVVTLPDATQTSVGAQFYYNNVSAHSFAMNDFAGNLIAVIPSGANSAGILYLTDNTTPGGTWFTIPAGGGSSAVNSIGAVPLGSPATDNLIIQSTTTNPITSSGTFEFSFKGDIGSLIGFGNSVGFPARTGAANGSTPNWALRTLQQGANIVIGNADGASNNPTIALSGTLTGLTSIAVGNLLIQGNEIDVLAGGVLTLNPETFTETMFPIKLLTNSGAANYIEFDSPSGNFTTLRAGALASGSPVNLVLPATAPGNGQVLGSDITGQLSWVNVAGLPPTSVVNSIPKFINTSGSLVSTNILITGTDNRDISQVNSLTVQNSIPSGAEIRLGVDGPTIISTTTDGLGLLSATATTTLAGTTGATATLLFYTPIDTNTYTGLTVRNTTSPDPAANIIFSLPGADGVNGALLMTDGATALSFVKTATSLSAANAAGVAKAWVVFNGTTGAIIGSSFNVASVTRNSAGDYTVNFAAALSSANFAVTINSNQLVSGTVTFPLAYYDGQTINNVVIHLGTVGGIATDSSSISVTCTVQ